MKKKYVAYYRVSTQKQGRSGLGLEAQKMIVNRYIEHGENEIIAEFVEIESGKKDHRVELEKAIALTKEEEATLIIAKLDRLSRNVGFIFALRDSKVNFVCCDIPDANTLTVGIFATMAQHERELISSRTKAAMAAKKAQGFKLGSPQNLTDHSRQRSIESKKKAARENDNSHKAYALIESLRVQGFGLRKISQRLNEFGFKTPMGKRYTPSAVKRVEELFG